MSSTRKIASTHSTSREVLDSQLDSLISEWFVDPSPLHLSLPWASLSIPVSHQFSFSEYPSFRLSFPLYSSSQQLLFLEGF